MNLERRKIAIIEFFAFSAQKTVPYLQRFTTVLPSQTHSKNNNQFLTFVKPSSNNVVKFRDSIFCFLLKLSRLEGSDKINIIYIITREKLVKGKSNVFR